MCVEKKYPKKGGWSSNIQRENKKIKLIEYLRPWMKRDERERDQIQAGTFLYKRQGGTRKTTCEKDQLYSTIIPFFLKFSNKYFSQLKMFCNIVKMEVNHKQVACSQLQYCSRLILVWQQHTERLCCPAIKQTCFAFSFFFVLLYSSIDSTLSVKMDIWLTRDSHAIIYLLLLLENPMHVQLK
jgi:hypothetical protein